MVQQHDIGLASRESGCESRWVHLRAKSRLHEPPRRRSCRWALGALEVQPSPASMVKWKSSLASNEVFRVRVLVEVLAWHVALVAFGICRRPGDRSASTPPGGSRQPHQAILITQGVASRDGKARGDSVWMAGHDSWSDVARDDHWMSGLRYLIAPRVQFGRLALASQPFFPGRDVVLEVRSVGQDDERVQHILVLQLDHHELRSLSITEGVARRAK